MYLLFNLIRKPVLDNHMWTQLMRMLQTQQVRRYLKKRLKLIFCNSAYLLKPVKTVHVRCKNKIDNLTILWICLIYFRKTWLNKFWLRNNMEEYSLMMIIPGWPMEGPCGVSPSVQRQWGSPSSSPLDFLSPSESFIQRVRVQTNPAARKSYQRNKTQTSPSCTQEPAVSDLVTFVVS